MYLYFIWFMKGYSPTANYYRITIERSKIVISLKMIIFTTTIIVLLMFLYNLVNLWIRFEILHLRAEWGPIQLIPHIEDFFFFLFLLVNIIIFFLIVTIFLFSVCWHLVVTVIVATLVQKFMVIIIISSIMIIILLLIIAVVRLDALEKYFHFIIFTRLLLILVYVKWAFHLLIILHLLDEVIADVPELVSHVTHIIGIIVKIRWILLLLRASINHIQQVYHGVLHCFLVINRWTIMQSALIVD